MNEELIGSKFEEKSNEFFVKVGNEVKELDKECLIVIQEFVTNMEKNIQEDKKFDLPDGIDEAQKLKFKEQFGIIETGEFYNRLNDIFKKLINCSGLSENIQLIIINNNTINAFIINDVEKRDEEKQKEKIYNSDSYKGKCVYIHLGIIKEFKKYKEKEAEYNYNKFKNRYILQIDDKNKKKKIEEGLLRIKDNFYKQGNKINDDLNDLELESVDLEFMHNITKKYHADKKITEDGVAYILAHEIQHLKQERKNNASINSLKQQEYDADLTGIKEILAKAGYNPREAIHVMEFLRSKSDIPFSNTHPNSESRVKEIIRLISDPEVPLKSLENTPKELELERKNNLAESIDEHIRNAKNINELLDQFSNETDNASKFLYHYEILKNGIKYLVLREIAKQEELKTFSGKVLYNIGLDINSEIEKIENIITEINNEKNKLDNKENLNYAEKKRLAELKERIKREENKINEIKKAEDTKYLFTINKRDLLNVLPEENNFLSSWANTELSDSFSIEENKKLLEITNNISNLATIKNNSGLLASNYNLINNEIENDEFNKIIDYWIKNGDFENLNDIESKKIFELVVNYIKCNCVIKDEKKFDLDSEQGRKNYIINLNISFLNQYEESYLKDVKKENIDKIIQPIINDTLLPLVGKFQVLIGNCMNDELSLEKKKGLTEWICKRIFNLNINNDSLIELYNYFEEIKLSDNFNWTQILDKQGLEQIINILPDLIYNIQEDIDPLISKYLFQHSKRFDFFIGEALNKLQGCSKKLNYNIVDQFVKKMKKKFLSELIYLYLDDFYSIASDSGVKIKPTLKNYLTEINIIAKDSGTIEEYWNQVKNEKEWSLQDKNNVKKEIIKKINDNNLFAFFLWDYGFIKKIDDSFSYKFNSKELKDFLNKICHEDMSKKKLDCVLEYILKDSLDNKNPDIIDNVLIVASVRQHFGMSSIDISSELLEKISFEKLMQFGLFCPKKINQSIKLDEDLNSLKIYIKYLSEAKDFEKISKNYQSMVIGNYQAENAFLNFLEDKISEVFKKNFSELEFDGQYNEYEFKKRKKRNEVIADFVIDKNWSLEQIDDYFPKSALKDNVLNRYIEENNLNLETILKLANKFRNSLKEIDIFRENFGFGKEKHILQFLFNPLPEEIRSEMMERYNSLKENNELIDYDELVYFDSRGTLFENFEKSFVKNPSDFFSPDNFYKILDNMPSSSFKDYILMKILNYKLLHSEDIKYEEKYKNVSSSILKYIGTYDKNFLKVNCVLEDKSTISFDFKSYKSEIIKKNIDEVFDYINSKNTKQLLARYVLDSSESYKNNLETIKKYLPEPSLLKDYYLKLYMDNNDLVPGQLKDIEKMLSYNVIKDGEIDSDDFIFIDIVRGISINYETKDRVNFMNWILGFSDDPPENIKVLGGLMGVSFRGFKRSFFGLSETELKQVLSEIFLGKNGVFNPKSNEEEILMDKFINNIFDVKIKNSINNEKIKDIAKDVFLTTFRYSLPERRTNFLSNLVLSMRENDKTIKFENFILLILQQLGPVGIKIGQVLSGNSNIPDKLRSELSSLTSDVDKMNKIGVLNIFENEYINFKINHIDEGLGSASIKQVNEAEILHNNKISNVALKVRKIMIDKYIEHDLLVVLNVFTLLREKWNIKIPKYLIGEIRNLLEEEIDFEKEYEKYMLIKKNIDGKQFNVPDVISHGKNFCCESIAKGANMNYLKEQDKDLYKQISEKVGHELFRQLFSTGVFHADLHNGNIYYNKQDDKITFIDLGAVGDIRKIIPKCKKLFLSIFNKDSKGTAKYVADMLQQRINVNSNEYKELVKTIDFIYKNNNDMSEQINKILYEVLNYGLPKPELRFFIKALATGSEHLKNISPDWKGEGLIKTLGKLNTIITTWFKK
jgi:predicted unusual protein kinase regulating ubiquinone biosynthesis (AarF/ABC1/UbiB family)